MKNILSVITILALVIIYSCNQPVPKNETEQRIENYLAAMDSIGFNGSVLVAMKGKIVASKGYGFTNSDRQIKNTPNTIYDIGSITKQFTATAILKLEMEGKLSTSDTISKYFDNVPKDKESITIHDLLRHQSGLIANIGRDYEKINEEEFLSKVFSEPLRFEVGTDFSYSNVGYSLLAMIIEKVSGANYEEYLYTNLWHPAQMEMTGYSRPGFDTSLIAVGYYQDDSTWGKPTDKEWDGKEPYWHLKGNGGVLSTTEDMYKWDRALLTDNILTKEAKSKLYHPALREGESDKSIYAYGWDVALTKRNTRQVWHNGSNRIFYADFLRYIDEDVTLIMLSNKFHPHFNRLNVEISKIIFNPKFKPEIPAEDNTENRNFTQHIIKTIEDSGLVQGKVAYQERKQSEHLLEYMMRNEGFNHIDNNSPAVAVQIFEMNAWVFQNSAKALQGLAEGYMETGSKELALEYFRKSLSIDPDNQFILDMIKKLEEQS